MSFHFIQESFFDIIMYISYILIIFSFFGLSSSAPIYLENLDYYIRIYICLFLIWRFNPLNQIDKFTKLDQKIAFSAGVFILVSSSFIIFYIFCSIFYALIPFRFIKKLL